jgi:hypothetical protein
VKLIKQPLNSSFGPLDPTTAKSKLMQIHIAVKEVLDKRETVSGMPPGSTLIDVANISRMDSDIAVHVRLKDGVCTKGEITVTVKPNLKTASVETKPQVKVLVEAVYDAVNRRVQEVHDAAFRVVHTWKPAERRQ